MMNTHQLFSKQLLSTALVSLADHTAPGSLLHISTRKGVWIIKFLLGHTMGIGSILLKQQVVHHFLHLPPNYFTA